MNETPRLNQPGEVLSLHQIDASKRPVWDFADCAAMFNLPLATFEMMVRETPMEGMFLMGRKRCAKPEDALAWLDHISGKFPYVPRKYPPRKPASNSEMAPK